MAIKEDMERAEARRLQPHYIASFFLEAFHLLGGSTHEREPRRYQIGRVPAPIRQRTHVIGTPDPVLTSYERITFEKDRIALAGKPLAEFVAPGHPLLDATIDLILERHRDLLKRGAVLVDPADEGHDPRVLIYLEHAIQDGRREQGWRRTISRRLEFVELDASGQARPAGYAPYLDYRPLPGDHNGPVEALLQGEWLRSDLDAEGPAYAIGHLVPRHLAEVRERREALIRLTMAAVRDRLVREITYWDHRALELEDQEAAGKQPKVNSLTARRRTEELTDRMQMRLADLERERHITALPPVVVGAALIVPAGLIRSDAATADGDNRDEVERRAMEAVMAAERRLGRVPRDVSKDHVGYDIESVVPGEGKLVFVEVKGRAAGARTVTITRNEVLTALNSPEDWVLAVVEVDGQAHGARYVRHYPFREPAFGEVSVNLDLKDVLA